MPAWKKIIVSSSNAHLSTVTASAFTASAAANAVGFFGTASWAVSASNAVIAGTASFLPVGTYQITASWAQSASQALTASFALNVTTPTSVISASVIQIYDSSSAAGTYYPTFVNGTSGYRSQSVDTGLTYTPNTDTLTVGNIGAVATTFNLATSTATTINIGATTANVVIPGNLIVQGATTTISSSNLLVADRFVLLASGSGAPTDGGIIIQSASNGSGSALYYDGDNTRWALATAVGQTDAAAVAHSYLVSVTSSGIDPTGNPTFGNTDAVRVGAMHVNTTTEDIWIWS